MHRYLGNRFSLIYCRQCLEQKLKKLKKQHRKRRHRSTSQPLGDRKNISERPTFATERSRIGDIETDFIVSGKDGAGYLLTVVDRRARVGFIQKIHPVTIAGMENAFRKIQLRATKLRLGFKSITTDNDILFQQHNKLEKLLKAPIYFCDPYSSWQKGTVENYNKQVRRYIPKGTDISKLDEKFISFVEERLNGRFLEVLGYRTPYEYLKEDIKKTH